ncbi:MAG: hypothetical protein JRN39_04835 [Nitrososphaerota archaeon]|nr:hypothetical protein [Nitrososphaerota archaeon]
MATRSDMNTKYAVIAAMVGALIVLSAVAGIGTYAASNDAQRLNQLKGTYHEDIHWGTPTRGSNYVLFTDSQSSTTNGNFVRTTFGVFAGTQPAPTMAMYMANSTGTIGPNGSRTFTYVLGGVRALGLVEYNDTAKTGIYTPSVDGRPLSGMNFAKMQWTISTNPITGPNGVPGYDIQMTTRNGSFSFTMSAQIYNTGVTLAGTPIAPTEAKINFIIDNYPFVSDSSRLALIASFGGTQHFGNSTRTTIVGTTGTQEQTKTINTQTSAVVSSNAFSYFTWASTAQVDGQNVPVLSKQMSNGTAFSTIQLDYPQGKNITHDPILGVGSGGIGDIPALGPLTGAVGVTSYMVIGAVVVVAFVSVLTLAARRRMIEPRLLV